MGDHDNSAHNVKVLFLFATRLVVCNVVSGFNCSGSIKVQYIRKQITTHKSIN